MTKTFTVFDASGTVIYKGRGKVGAAQKACDAIHDYRGSVRSASGYAHGNPAQMGHVEVDGVLADGYDVMSGESLYTVEG